MYVGRKKDFFSSQNAQKFAKYYADKKAAAVLCK